MQRNDTGYRLSTAGDRHSLTFRDTSEHGTRMLAEFTDGEFALH